MADGESVIVYVVLAVDRTGASEVSGVYADKDLAWEATGRFERAAVNLLRYRVEEHRVIGL